jgi:hypothetical protein
MSQLPTVDDESNPGSAVLNRFCALGCGQLQGWVAQQRAPQMLLLHSSLLAHSCPLSFLGEQVFPPEQ